MSLCLPLRYFIFCLFHLIIFLEVALESSLPVVWLAMEDQLQTDHILSASMQGLVSAGLFYGSFFSAFTGIVMNSIDIPVSGFILLCLAITAILGLVLPSMLLFFPKFAFIATLLQGLSHGIIGSGLTMILTFWTPDKENTTVSALVYCAYLTGRLGATMFCSIVAQKIYWSAPSVLFGTLLLISTAALLITLSDKPETSKKISESERDYIISHRKLVCCKRNGNLIHNIKNIPWKCMFTSLPMYAMMLTKGSRTVSIVFLLFGATKYLHDVIEVSLIGAGSAIAMQFSVSFVSGLTTGRICDYFRTKELLSTTMTRKLGMTVGTGIEVFGFMIICLSKGKVLVHAACTFIAIGLGLINANSFANGFDIAPRYATMTAGLCMAFNSLVSVSIIQPVEQIVPGSPWSYWLIVFLTLPAVKIVILIFFLVFGTGEMQSWNDDLQITEKS